MNPFRGYYDEAKDCIVFLVNIQADCPQYGDADDSNTHHSSADTSGTISSLQRSRMTTMQTVQALRMNALPHLAADLGH